MEKTADVSRFASLTRDLIRVILTKVGAASAPDFHNAIISYEEIHASSDTREVCRSLSLAPLVKKPLAASAYEKTMQKCLAHNNPDANYIQGLLDYFRDNDIVGGLTRLAIAADAGHKEATYICAVLLLCNGRTEEGELYFGHLQWKKSPTAVDAAWKNVKASLHGLPVIVRGRYLRNIRKMKPTESCHFNDMDNTCAKCFYYKRMKKFIYMM